MKNLIFSSIAILMISISSFAQDLTPYIKIGDSNESIQQVSQKVINALESNDYIVLGTYNPSNKSTIKVIAFTRTDLKNTVIKVKDRGALAAVFKVGLEQKNGKVIISYTNPDYILRAYLGDNYNTYKTVFQRFSSDLKTTFSSIGNNFSPFGGTVKAENLKKYHYKIMMPYFTDPVELNDFSSFEEGLKVIENNLKAKKGNTVEVYKLVYAGEKVAVFGVGLQNKDEGEAHFLPIIGEAHVAALPYEIILQGNKATMLHGKYRLALHWPDLTMGTFMKIMSTPGDIEDALEAVCK
jgi:effector-binding domain-containing protein